LPRRGDIRATTSRDAQLVKNGLRVGLGVETTPPDLPSLAVSPRREVNDKPPLAGPCILPWRCVRHG
jgi:hypothetical protein